MASSAWNCQRRSPASSPSARKRPSSTPTYTVSPTIAAVDRIASPVSYFQRTPSSRGSGVSATPVRCGLPRNMDHCGPDVASGVGRVVGWDAGAVLGAVAVCAAAAVAIISSPTSVVAVV